jgi:hypothetical protein
MADYFRKSFGHLSIDLTPVVVEQMPFSELRGRPHSLFALLFLVSLLPTLTQASIIDCEEAYVMLFQRSEPSEKELLAHFDSTGIEISSVSQIGPTGVFKVRHRNGHWYVMRIQSRFSDVGFENFAVAFARQVPGIAAPAVRKLSQSEGQDLFKRLEPYRRGMTDAEPVISVALLYPDDGAAGMVFKANPLLGLNYRFPNLFDEIKGNPVFSDARAEWEGASAQWRRRFIEVMKENVPESAHVAEADYLHFIRTHQDCFKKLLGKPQKHLDASDLPIEAFTQIAGQSLSRVVILLRSEA